MCPFNNLAKWFFSLWLKSDPLDSGEGGMHTALVKLTNWSNPHFVYSVELIIVLLGQLYLGVLLQRLCYFNWMKYRQSFFPFVRLATKVNQQGVTPKAKQKESTAKWLIRYIEFIFRTPNIHKFLVSVLVAGEVPVQSGASALAWFASCPKPSTESTGWHVCIFFYIEQYYNLIKKYNARRFALHY